MLGRSDIRVYRLGRFYLILGGIGFVGYTIGAAMTLVQKVEPPHTEAQYVLLAAIPAAFALLSLWIAAAYFRERLVVSGDGLTQRRVFGGTELEFAEVTQARWRCARSPLTLKLRAGKRRVRIDFGNFTGAEQRELITLLRGKLSLDVQQGWNEELSPAGELTVPPRKIRREPPFVVAALMLGGLSWVCLYCSSLEEIGREWVAVGIILGLGALWSLWVALKSPLLRMLRHS